MSFWNRLFGKKDTRETTGTMSVEEFFSSVKNTAEELQIVKERAKGYEEAVKNARATGQRALVERLEAGLNAVRMETQLVAMGLTKYLSEGSLVRFYKASKKGLRLDWVANFTRTIPPEVATKKVRADEVGAFDNYVVLHYDPAEKAFSETEWEQLARTSKDPILFGLMKGRRILYFVGDWIDEVCDLTLDQLADVIGKDAVKTIA
jgi:predicted DNA-binding WGR domain protein